MGSCFSRTTTPSHKCRTSPPSSIEETVKEVVLSSEKILSANKQEQEDFKISKPAIVKTKEENHQSPYKINQKGVQNNTKVEFLEALSDTSTATTVTEKKDYYEDSTSMKKSPAKLPPRNRSFSGDIGSKRDRVIAKSPSWRFEQYTGRVNGVPVRMVQSGRVTSGSRIDPGRRDPGERSGRRSMSPGTRLVDGSSKMNPGRTPSTRRTNTSPGRINRNPSPKKIDHNVAEEGSNAVESLENPLVSLECFIFL